MKSTYHYKSSDRKSDEVYYVRSLNLLTGEERIASFATSEECDEELERRYEWESGWLHDWDRFPNHERAAKYYEEMPV